MHKSKLSRVVFYSRGDMLGVENLEKGEKILRAEIKYKYDDINEILELYNLKKYIDAELYLKSWTAEDVLNFKNKAERYGEIVGKFMSDIAFNYSVETYDSIFREYISSFWELINSHGFFKRIQRHDFKAILNKEPYVIYKILTHKSLVQYFAAEIREFLLTFLRSAEILLQVYEVKDEYRQKTFYLPPTLSIKDKEMIISNYLDSTEVNLNYLGIIKNAKNQSDFRLSDKIRLKAKRVYTKAAEAMFSNNNNGTSLGIQVHFTAGMGTIKSRKDENGVTYYSYSRDFINSHLEPYVQFENFKYLFEYVDACNRINLISKRNQMHTLEWVMGVHSQHEYRIGTLFWQNQITSNIQLYGYSLILKELNSSLEGVLHFVLTTQFRDRYRFDFTPRFSIPNSTVTYLEKVRLLAPEFESILKQYKLFVEDGYIDFELLQISSSPSLIADIPSLVPKKYVYLNESNLEIQVCARLLFSDQTSLNYVDPFKASDYYSFFYLIANERVEFDNYLEYQKHELQYLIDRNLIAVDETGFIQIANPTRLIILKDIYENEVASYYHYSFDCRMEIERLAFENGVYFESSLFSKPEQSYFNYFLNKKEFTNGLDLRNSYLHGTQADPSEENKHKSAYFMYLKLLTLALLKIDDDFLIARVNGQEENVSNS